MLDFSPDTGKKPTASPLATWAALAAGCGRGGSVEDVGAVAEAEAAEEVWRGGSSAKPSTLMLVKQLHKYDSVFHYSCRHSVKEKMCFGANKANNFDYSPGKVGGT